MKRLPKVAGNFYRTFLMGTNDLKQAWRLACNYSSFRWQFIVTMCCVLSFTVVFNRFFDFVESREGQKLTDFVLDAIPSMNVSWAVFFFLYSGIIGGLYAHRAHPKTILVAFQTYLLVTLTRMGTITLWPLEAPDGYLPLREPFVQLFTNEGKIISKDLFFSGHMSTILSLYFASHRRHIKTYLLICSVMIGILLLVQHVHYTIDVIAAIPFTFIIFLICKNFLGGISTGRTAKGDLR